MTPQKMTSQKSSKSSASKTLSKSVIKQAQQGNLKAVKALLRQQLKQRPQSRDLRLKVSRKNSTLLVHLTGAVAPDQAQLMAWLKPFFAKLSIAKVSGVRFLGHRQGSREPIWVEQIPLKPLPRRSWLTPTRLGQILGGLTFLVLLWGIAAMVRGPGEQTATEPAETTESAEPAAEQVTSPLEEGVVQVAASGGLPAYKVYREEIFDGKRIQVDTDDPNLSEETCIAIAAKFLEEAGVEGKVVVQKPNPKPPWNGKRAPYCANNNNGYGTFFNNEYF